MWVNLLQRLAEAVLFFNPALWYVSRRLSTLREFCCDELTCRATAKSGADARTSYAWALLRVVELSRGQPAGSSSDLAALAASGRSPSELRRRVAHLLGEPLREPVWLPRGGVFMTAVLAALLLIALSTFKPAADSATAAATEVSYADEVNREAEAQTPPANTTPEEADREYTFPITVSGHALDPSGNPLSNAEVYLASPRTHGKPLAIAKTDGQGAYRFESIKLPIERADTNNGRDKGCFEVFGRAEGFGFAWRPLKWFYPKPNDDTSFPEPMDDLPRRFFPGDKIELDLHFGPPATLRGRLVNDLGEPIVGATLAIRDGKPWGDDGSRLQLESFNWRALVPESVKLRRTDEQGRFAFTGLPVDCEFRLDVRPAGHSPRSIVAATREGVVATARGTPAYSGDFELVFPRPRQVKIRVVYGDTLKPAQKVGVGGMVTEAGFWETTNEEGFIETPLAEGRYKIVASPRYGSPYLKTEAEIAVSAETVKEPFTIELRPAAVVDITVVDAITGKPLEGVDVGLNGSVHGYRSWEVETRISHYERPRSDKNGKMRVLFEPGQHRISIGLEAYPAGYVPIDVGGKDIDCPLGKPTAVEFTLLNTKPPPAREPAPAAPKRAANSQQTNQPTELSIIIARHVLLLEGKEIVTWTELEKKIAAMPDPSQVYPTFYITRGAMEEENYKLAKNEIWRLRTHFKFKGHSEASLWQRSDFRYDRIEEPADLVPDEKLRVEGKVLDQEGKAVAGAEVILATPVDESISYKSYDMAILEGRIRNRLDHIVTDADATGRFSLYPPKDENYYVVALHPTAGFSVAAGNQFSTRPGIRLIPWSTLAVEVADEPELRQRVSISTRVPAHPEVLVSQEPRGVKNSPATQTFEFAHVPAIWDTSISRFFPDTQGVSIGLSGASVQLLAGETRRINLGALTKEQRAELEDRRQRLRQPREENQAQPPKPPPQEAKADTGSDLLRELRKARAPLLAEMAQRHGYGLSPDQVLRRVAPPFPPVRMNYYRVGHPSQAESIRRGPSAMTFHWDGKELLNWGMTFGQTEDDGYNLVGLLDAVQGIKSQEVEGPAALLNTQLPGDWVVRPGQSNEAVVRELERIVREELKLPLRLEFREVQREVYVARGRYRLTPLPGQPAEEKLHLTDETITTDPVQIFGEALVPNSGAGGGTGEFAEFLKWLGRWIETPILDEATERPKRQISWHLHERSPSTAQSRQEDHDAERVLRNITAQTGLSFTKERRGVKLLFVEKKE
jgi:protocatechuate 3,4-dioxygenase beta subunit